MNSAPLKKYERDAAMDIEADRRRETESESWTVSYGYLLFFLESCAHFDRVRSPRRHFPTGAARDGRNTCSTENKVIPSGR